MSIQMGVRKVNWNYLQSLHSGLEGIHHRPSPGFNRRDPSLGSHQPGVGTVMTLDPDPDLAVALALALALEMGL